MTQLMLKFCEKNNIHNCELQPILINNKIIEGYSISRDGTVYSHYKPRLPSSGSGYIIDYSYKKKLAKANNNGYKIVNLYFKDDFYDDDYEYKRSKGGTQNKNFRIHILVMDSFKPFDQFLPPSIQEYAEYYNSLPEGFKFVIRQSFLVHHIDHDKSNNSIDNLERVTSIENARAALKFYNETGSLNDI